MVCEVMIGRWLRRCGENAKLYRIEWRGQCLGEYKFCSHHCSAACGKPVTVIRLDGRTRQPKDYGETKKTLERRTA